MSISDTLLHLRDQLQDARQERDQLRSRVLELELAIAPFAEILLTECNDDPRTKLMSDSDLFPVPMKLVRDAARAHAGT